MIGRSTPSSDTHCITLNIHDDGVGMSKGTTRQGLGVLGMRERVSAFWRHARPGCFADANGGFHSVIRILLIDDHIVVRAGYRRFLERSNLVSVVPEGESAGYAIFNLGARYRVTPQLQLTA